MKLFHLLDGDVGLARQLAIKRFGKITLYTALTAASSALTNFTDVGTSLRLFFLGLITAAIAGLEKGFSTAASSIPEQADPPATT